jgi:hypothetical protein
MNIPDWIPADAWAGWIEMRKDTLRKPLKTQRAFDLAVSKLDQLRKEGHEPGAVLDQSTMQGWQGLFAVRQERQGQAQAAPRFAALGKHGQATANNLNDWLEGA